MAAPTPVSALVHSSTLVTAGVFILIRFFPIFSTGFINEVLLIIGALTITISRLGAIYEIDLKKIIALSTLRQLGLIIVALRIKLYLLAFFHLLTHALFKASLFLCAGIIIHFYKRRQDIRNLRITSSYMPLTVSCLRVCSLSLGGIPFLSAFYSKDKIIEEAFTRGFNIFCLSLLLISVCFTLIYRLRLIFYITSKRYDINYEFNYDSRTITKRIFGLTLGGIVGGRVF
jgi:NADH-ubiquinone oxidoreductase chain 5